MMREGEGERRRERGKDERKRGEDGEKDRWVERGLLLRGGRKVRIVS